MNPAFSWTKTIDVEIDNGCLADQMTNTGDWVDGSAGVSDGVTSGTAGTQIMGFSADTRDSNVWVYYINEQSEYVSANPIPLIKDDTNLNGGVVANPYVREWPTSWTQTVEGCPVEYIIYVEQTDSDGIVTNVDTNGLDSGVATTDTGSGSVPILYSDVINYDSTSITNLLAGLTQDTWWQQTNYYNDGNGGIPTGNEYNAIQINTADADTVLPYNAVVQVRATDYALDGQSWDLKVGLKSTHSTDASQIGSDDFTLELRDICHDVPTVAPTVTTQTEFVVYLWD